MKVFLLAFLILFSELTLSQNYIDKDANKALIITSKLFLSTICSLYSLGAELPLIARYLFRNDQINNNPMKILILDRIFSDEDGLIAILDLILNTDYEYTILAVQSVVNELFEIYYDVNDIPDQTILDKLHDYI